MCRYAEKQVGYMACSILLTEVRHFPIWLCGFVARQMHVIGPLRSVMNVPPPDSEALQLRYRMTSSCAW